jgi:hypothetical protein
MVSLKVPRTRRLGRGKVREAIKGNRTRWPIDKTRDHGGPLSRIARCLPTTVKNG